MIEASLFLGGAISLASLVVTLFFLRFWRATRDPFFLYFALAFGLECVNRTVAGLLALSDSSPLFYLPRVISYGLIIVAIWQKNRR